jgi:RsiW-degrading membrane proteinase PrsW (M82 family)
MILAIIFAQLWGVIQLIVLSSMSRTVRVRTVLAAMAVGFYAIAPVTAFLQLSWIRLAALLLGKSISDVTGFASYTVDPFIEEAIKLLPLAMLMLIPAIRRQWSVTDCVLIAAATGSGFGLAEHLFRFGDYPGAAESVTGGWALMLGRNTPLVPGIARTLTSWLPPGVFFIDDVIRVNWHLAWSAIGGLALGLVVRNPGRAARVAAGGLFLFIGLDHAAGNTKNIQDTWLALLATPLQQLTTWLGVLVFIAVVVAWRLDWPSQRAGMALGPLLAAEQSSSPQMAGTLTAALSRLPWSIPWVLGFDRARRAYHAARAAAPEGDDDLIEVVLAQRDSVDRKLSEPKSSSPVPSGLTPSAVRSAMRHELRRPPVIISLVLLAPSVLYLIIGGWPQTAWIQSVLTARVVWPLVLLITVLSQARIAWAVVVGLRKLPATARLPIGDDAAILGLQLACGVGAVALGGFTLMRVFGGVSPGETLLSHAHAADAINRLKPGGGAASANSAGAFDPPPPSLDLPNAAPSDAAPDGAAPNDAPQPKPNPSPPPAPPKPTPQEVADRAAAAAAAAAAKADAAAAKADADALDAQQARTDAARAADSADIKKATADPGTDPDVAAARERNRSAQNASEQADAAALDGDDPWDPNAPNKTAADGFHEDAKAAQQAQDEAENAFAERQAADAEAAKAAANDAQDAVDAANAKAAAAHSDAAAAQENSANAAHDAARAADPQGAAADDAAKDYAAAQKREAEAWEGTDNQAYHDAHQATAIAKERADAARAAADAARNDPWKVKKP